MAKAPIICYWVEIGFVPTTAFCLLWINSFIQWVGDNIEVVTVDSSFSISIAEAMSLGVSLVEHGNRFLESSRF